MSRALVIGGAGFIGSNVVRLLAGEGFEVVVLDNLSTGCRGNLDGLRGVRLVEGDVCHSRADATAPRAAPRCEPSVGLEEGLAGYMVRARAELA